MSQPGSNNDAPSRPQRASRNESVTSVRSQHHAPTVSSGLRQSHTPSSIPSSPEVSMGSSISREDHVGPKGEEERSDTQQDARPPQPNLPSTQAEGRGREVRGEFRSPFAPNARTRLLDSDNWDNATGCGESDCDHGTYSPRYRSPHRSIKSYGSIGSEISRDGFGGRMPGVREDLIHSTMGDTIADGLLGGRGSRMSTTKYLAKRHGVKNSRMMYLSYYIPFFNWIRQYNLTYLRGDLVAALTMASFYIPMALSYASNLGHMPPINGLYAFVFNPFIYAILGSCPQMVVGPEAAGSLLTGEVVRQNIEKGHIHDSDGSLSAEVGGIVTSMAGAVILVAGMFRLGFLDNVLSRPFLRGFISAIGIVIFLDQLIPELGLDALASHVGGVKHGSCIDKAVFIVRHIQRAHGPTAAVSLGSFGIIMVLREVKRRLQPRFPSVAYIPDRFIVVVLSAVFAWKFDWEHQGIEVLGNIESKGTPFRVHWPLSFTHLKYSSDAFSTAFIVALLGFFESSVAAKSLGTGESSGGLKNTNLSANRELVALGVANITGGLFMSLPAFGGYGRSKVNSSTGGKTPMSSIFLSLLSLLCTLFLLPYFYYIPKGVLSAMISVVAYSLLEEAPHDLKFFWQIRGWSELILMLLIFAATIFWNLKIGIAVGIGLSLLRVIRHSTRPRIQILGRVPGTTDKFENAELVAAGGGDLEFVEGCLIVKIPEPLTFANTGDLKARLRRLEDHGTGAAHPALPRIRHEAHNKNVIFDVHGVTGLDGAGAQVLRDIVAAYRSKDVRVFFCRCPKEGTTVWRLFETSGIVELCGGRRHFVDGVEQALKMTELESLSEEIGPGHDGLLEGLTHEHGVGDPALGRSRSVA